MTCCYDGTTDNRPPPANGTIQARTRAVSCVETRFEPDIRAASRKAAGPCAHHEADLPDKRHSAYAGRPLGPKHAAFGRYGASVLRRSGAGSDAGTSSIGQPCLGSRCPVILLSSRDVHACSPSCTGMTPMPFALEAWWPRSQRIIDLNACASCPCRPSVQLFDA